jgi:large repetitive protein
LPAKRRRDFLIPLKVLFFYPKETSLKLFQTTLFALLALICVNANADGLKLTAPAREVAAGETLQFTTTGGTPPYNYSVTEGPGSIDPASGIYTAPATVDGPTKVTVRVDDSASNFGMNKITVKTLLVSAPAHIIAAGGTLQFTTTGGTAPYQYSITTGPGSIDPVSGIYTAPATVTGPTKVTIQVDDSAGNSDTNTITVKALLLAAPAHTIAAGETLQFTTTGGTSPYKYSITTGPGSIDPDSGIYTAPATVDGPTKVTIRVDDSASNFDIDTIRVR